MITRLQVDGFKNLRDVDIRLGAFNCIAGANGVGKSNLFDVIRFLGALASEKKLDEAARTVRDEDGKSADVRAIFFQEADGSLSSAKFGVEMIIPKEAVDDLGQTARGKTTFVRYDLELCYRASLEERQQFGEIQILGEELRPLSMSGTRSRLGFDHSKSWRDSVVRSKRQRPLISTVVKEAKLSGVTGFNIWPGARTLSVPPKKNGSATPKEAESEAVNETLIRIHQDGEGRHAAGRAYERSARRLPRTALSVASAENPTMMCAKAEMQSWELLQLEPSAMRRADSRNQEPRMDMSGAHLPATLHRLARQAAKAKNGELGDGALYQGIANRLAELLGEVSRIEVEENERTDTFTVFAVGADGRRMPARSLSDGTLRFLALLVKEKDVRSQGVICLEEPENGIHPQRIPAMLRLLQDIAVDVEEPCDEDNPLRQVIFNTHSPAVVQEVPADSLLMAEPAPFLSEGKQLSAVRFACLSGTWRADQSPAPPLVSLGTLRAYLGALPAEANGHHGQAAKRLRDRPDVQQMQRLLPGFC